MNRRVHRPRVVLGVDDSLTGLAALRVAVVEARRRDAALYAVRAVTYFAPNADDEVRMIDTTFVQAIGDIPSDVEIHREARAGNPCCVLPETARGPEDLIVVGSGKGRWQPLMNGSVAQGVLRQARCPVLIVPAPEMARTAHHLPRRAHHGRDPVWDQFDRQASRMPPDQPA